MSVPFLSMYSRTYIFLGFIDVSFSSNHSIFGGISRFLKPSGAKVLGARRLYDIIDWRQPNEMMSNLKLFLIDIIQP
jgi:hypothetical protein